VRTASWPIIASTTSRVSSGRDGIADVAQLLHQLGVDASRPAVSMMTMSWSLASAWAQRGARHVHRVADPVARLRREDRTPAWALTTCSWSTALGRWRSAATSSGAWPWPVEQVRQLAREGRLAGTLEAGQHDDGGRGLGERQPSRSPPQDGHELLVDDLDDLLRGLSAPDTSADRARSLDPTPT
jgi:hypothetical protein